MLQNLLQKCSLFGTSQVRGCGEIGKRSGLKIRRLSMTCGFKSRRPHHPEIRLKICFALRECRFESGRGYQAALLPVLQLLRPQLQADIDAEIAGRLVFLQREVQFQHLLEARLPGRAVEGGGERVGAAVQDVAVGVGNGDDVGELQPRPLGRRPAFGHDPGPERHRDLPRVRQQQAGGADVDDLGRHLHIRRVMRRTLPVAREVRTIAEHAVSRTGDLARLRPGDQAAAAGQQQGRRGQAEKKGAHGCAGLGHWPLTGSAC